MIPFKINYSGQDINTFILQTDHSKAFTSFIL